MVATRFSTPDSTANASAVHTEMVRPVRMTRARASMRSPVAGASKLILNSIDSTALSAGIWVKAA
jgi:hypothetical protein